MSEERYAAHERLPLGKSLIWILVSTLVTSASVGLVWLYFQYVDYRRANDSSYKIIAIVQTGPEREVLKTIYLAELLNLSIDRPQNLYTFNPTEARKKLLASPLIKDATVKRIKPGTVYIDYAVRQPIAYLADYVNTGLDEEGYLFPISPFFTPKRLPEIYLGLPAFEAPMDEAGREGGRWGQPLKNRHVVLALEMFNLWDRFRSQLGVCQLKRIDVSHAYSDSYGKREILLVIEDYIEKQVEGRPVLYLFPRILRLPIQDFDQQMANYLALKEHLDNQAALLPPLASDQNVARAMPQWIDLRVPQLAFLKL
jgi:hypothetical protein